MAASPGRAGALRTEARTLDWAVVAVLALGALVRALRFWGVISWAHWDEANVAIPAIQILGGTFPVHHVGVEYVGATGAYPLAAWFAVAGHSTAALDVFGYAAGLAVLWTSFLVARRVLPPRGALLTLCVLAAPPLLLAYWSLGGTLNPTLTLLLGNLVLLGTHTAFFRRPGAAAPMLAVGLLVGLGWWVYPLIIVYCRRRPAGRSPPATGRSSSTISSIAMPAPAGAPGSARRPASGSGWISAGLRKSRVSTSWRSTGWKCPPEFWSRPRRMASAGRPPSRCLGTGARCSGPSAMRFSRSGAAGSS